MRTPLQVTALAALITLAGCSAPTSVAAPIAAPRAAAPVTGPVPASIAGKVTRVIDGDTVHVRTADGRDLDIRVIGANTPETVAPGKPVECFGPQASAEAHRVLDGQPVTVVADYTQGNPDHNDRYGRALRYITLPTGEDLSRHLVAGGFARAYKVSGAPPVQWQNLLADQRAAQAAKRGLWAPRPAGCEGNR